MPTFTKDSDGFQMEKPSGFKMKYKKSNFPFKGDGRAESSAFQASEYPGGVMPQTYGTVPSPTKKRDDKKVPKIPTKSPHDVVKKLQAKKANGTITPPELKKLNKLMKQMDKDYSTAGWDKE